MMVSIIGCIFEHQITANKQMEQKMEWYEMDDVKFNDNDALIAEAISNSEYMDYSDPVGHPVPMDTVVCCFNSLREARQAVDGAVERGLVKVTKFEGFVNIELTDKGGMVEW